MDNPLIWQITVQVVLILCNAVFACAEIAVISMNDNKLAALAAAGDKRAVRLARLTSQPARFLATIQVAITLSGFLGSAFAAENFSDMLVAWVLSLGVRIPAATLDAISVVIITLILSYFTLVFGELVPKRVAMKKAEALALGLSGLISFIAKLFSPIVWMLTASTNLMLRLFGIDPNAEDEAVSEEEIRMMVDVGSQKGVIDRAEREMIQKVFEFDDLSVEEFATHRVEVDVLWLEDSPEQWDTLLRESRHSMFPVCGETADQVVGVLSAKDYFRLADRTRESVLQNAVRPPYFVPESLRADVLFRRMQQSRNHFAVVLDEYGGVSGIVTINDLLEQLVGALDDEQDEACAESELEQLDEHTWRICGSAELDQVARALAVSLPVEEYDTFGGFVFGAYGAIPEDGERFELDAGTLHITVTDVRDHRVCTALVSVEG